jgi:hypothetical protein
MEYMGALNALGVTASADLQQYASGGRIDVSGLVVARPGVSREPVNFRSRDLH